MEEAKTHRFYLKAHLTWEVDEHGTVIGLQIMPYDSAFDILDVDVDDEAGLIEADRVMTLADAQGWYFDALAHLPAGVRWDG